MKSTDAQIFLRDHYEVFYGIYNHNDDKNRHPLALVLQNWNEDVVTQGPLRERLSQFMKTKVGDSFNLSFPEFIELPSYVCNMMIELCEEEARRQKPIVDKALEDLNNLTNKPS